MRMPREGEWWVKLECKAHPRYFEEPQRARIPGWASKGHEERDAWVQHGCLVRLCAPGTSPCCGANCGTREGGKCGAPDGEGCGREWSPEQLAAAWQSPPGEKAPAPSVPSNPLVRLPREGEVWVSLPCADCNFAGGNLLRYLGNGQFQTLRQEGFSRSSSIPREKVRQAVEHGALVRAVPGGTSPCCGDLSRSLRPDLGPVCVRCGRVWRKDMLRAAWQEVPREEAPSPCDVPEGALVFSDPLVFAAHPKAAKRLAELCKERCPYVGAGLFAGREEFRFFADPELSAEQVREELDLAWQAAAVRLRQAFARSRREWPLCGGEPVELCFEWKWLAEQGRVEVVGTLLCKGRCKE